MTDQGSSPLSCELCSRTFPDITRLRRHFTSHKRPERKQRREIISPISKGPAEFECVECGRMFRWQMTLKRHLRQHEKNRHQTCGECGVTFRSESYLIAHMEVSHPFRSSRAPPGLNNRRNDVLISMQPEDRALERAPPPAAVEEPPPKLRITSCFTVQPFEQFFLLRSLYVQLATISLVVAVSNK